MAEETYTLAEIRAMRPECPKGHTNTRVKPLPDRHSGQDADRYIMGMPRCLDCEDEIKNADPFGD